MKNVLLIADYLKLDHWGMLAYSYLDALRQDETINLVARQIDFGQPKRPTPEWLPELENKTEEKYHVVLQCCPPQFYNVGPGYYGIFIMEPTYLANKNWVRRLNMLPLIVSSRREDFDLNLSGVKSDITIISPYVDPSFLYQVYQLPPNLNKKNYTFYWVGEFGERSNYKDVCRAFNAEFTSRDNVDLIMYFLAEPKKEIGQAISNELIEIKKSLHKHQNLQNYPQEIVQVGQNLDEIRSLHIHADCLIDISRGNMSPITIEAKLSCRKIINQTDFNVPIFGSPIYGCDSMWGKPDFACLRAKMRDNYKNRINNVVYHMNERYSLDNVLNMFRRNIYDV